MTAHRSLPRPKPVVLPSRVGSRQVMGLAPGAAPGVLNGQSGICAGAIRIPDSGDRASAVRNSHLRLAGRTRDMAFAGDEVPGRRVTS